jgi:hypothetical protein
MAGVQQFDLLKKSAVTDIQADLEAAVAADTAAAAASASAADASAIAAAGSASAASDSASDASDSAIAAAASYDQFDDRYLGDKASDPTLDNDGNALLDGALYWNTALKRMRIYDLATTAWVDAFSPAENKAIVSALKAATNDDSSLNLNFAYNGYVADGLAVNLLDLATFTRATDETAFNQRKVLQTFGSGVPAVPVYDPSTGEPLGLQVFEQRTNLLFNSGWAGATDVAAPTNWIIAAATGSQTVATSSIFSDANSIEFSTTSGRQFLSRATSVAALSVHTATVDCDVVSGSNSFQNLFTTVGTATGTIAYFVDGVLQSGAYIVPVGKHKLKMVITADADGGLLDFRCGMGTGGNVTGVARFELPQLELGSFETPFILTPVGASATRNASVAVINDIDESEWWNPSEGTFVVEYELPTPFSSQPSSSSGVLWVHNDITNRGISLRKKTTSTQLTVITRDASGFNEISIAVPDISAKKFKVAFSFASSYVKASVNGSAVGSASGSVIDLSVLKKIQNGYQNAAGGAGYLNGTIAKIQYYPTAVSDAKLQELSTL